MRYSCLLPNLHFLSVLEAVLNIEYFVSPLKSGSRDRNTIKLVSVYGFVLNLRRAMAYME